MCSSTPENHSTADRAINGGSDKPAVRRKKLLVLGAAAAAILGVVVIGVLVSQLVQDSGSSTSASSKGLEESPQDANMATPSLRASAPPSMSLGPTSSGRPSIPTTTTAAAAPSASPLNFATSTTAPSATTTTTSTELPSLTPAPSASLPTATVAAVSTPLPTASFSASNAPIFSAQSSTAEPAPPTGIQTMTPTATPIDPDLRFRIKMHWEEDFFWQEETIERRWCTACTVCDELNFSLFPISDFNCNDQDDKNRVCQPGDQLWLRNCDDGYGTIFQARYTYTGNLTQQAVMLQVADTTVCVTRTKQRYVTLELCNILSPTQMWKRVVSATQEFQLTPTFFHENDNGLDFCATQQHHPKEFEIMGLKDCPEAAKYHTSEWDIYLE